MIPGIVAAQSGQVAATGYNATVSALAPLLWWRLDETTGTTMVDSSGNGYAATARYDMGGGKTIASPTGFAGLGSGQKTNSFTSTANAALAFGGSSTSSWTMAVWVTGASGGSNQYITARGNNAAIIYGYATDTVEFFATGYSGTNPRTGSGISLPGADTTTPHLIVYRYDNGTWSGFKNGASVFSVARSFGLGTTTQEWVHGANTFLGTTIYLGTGFDVQLYTRALTDAEILSIYNTRNSV